MKTNTYKLFVGFYASVIIHIGILLEKLFPDNNSLKMTPYAIQIRVQTNPFLKLGMR